MGLPVARAIFPILPGKMKLHMRIISRGRLHRLVTGLLPAAVILTVTTAAAIAQDLKAPLPVDPAMVKGKFPNGLTYYVRSNSKPAQKVELRLVVKAGSVLETDEQQGLAHFMEHMNFNGTKHFKRNDLVGYLQSIGVEFGADLNAYTAFDQTVYILPIPTDKPGNLEKGFQIIEDWAHNALLKDADIDAERGVVLEESRLDKGADRRMLEQYFPRILSGSKYAQRLPIGKDEVLKHFRYETLRKFYRDWYRPDLQAVAVVGDIDTGTAMKLIRKHFAGLTNPQGAPERKYEAIPARTQPEAMVVTDKEATSSTLQLLFSHMPEQKEVTLGDYRDMVKRQLALSMLNRRLSDLARGSNPPFTFAQVYFDKMIPGYESFSAVTMFGAAGPEQALKALTAELIRAREYGFTQSELELAKAAVMSSMEKAYNERNTTNSNEYIDEMVRNFLDNEPVPGIENEYHYYQAMLPGIQLTEVGSQPGIWMKNANTFTLITAPEKEDLSLPSEAALLAMTREGFAQQVTAMQEAEVASSLLDKMPVPGMVVSRQEDKGLGATTFRLSNGVMVTVKPTDFKADEVLLEGVRKGGTNSYSVADKYSAQYATDVVSAMGAGHFTPTELEKTLAGKTVKLRTDIGEISNTVSGGSSVRDFETLLQLMYLTLTEPRQDEALFQAFRERKKAQLAFIGANPRLAFMDTTIKSLYRNNPLAKSPVPKAEDFDQISLDRAVAIYRSEIGDASGYHFFIVGNVDIAQALPLIEKYIGSLPVSAGTAQFKDNGVRPVAGDYTLKFRKGTEKQSLIMARYYGELPYSEDLALKANALTEILNIRVIEELREKLGAIYGGGYYASVAKEPYPRYAIGLQLPCGPENVDKLLTAADAEISAIKAKGPSKKDLDKVKSQWHEQHRTAIRENRYWQDKLEDILFWDKSREHVLEYDAWIDKLTPEDIRQTAQLLLNGKNRFVSILYPEA